MHGGAAAAAAGGGGGGAPKEPQGLDPNKLDPNKREHSRDANVLVRCPYHGNYTWDRALVIDVTKTKEGEISYTVNYDDISDDPMGEPQSVPQDKVFALPDDFADWPAEKAGDNTKKHEVDDDVRVQVVSTGGYYNWFRATILAKDQNDYTVRFDADKEEKRTRNERIHALAPAAAGPAGPAGLAAGLGAAMLGGTAGACIK